MQLHSPGISANQPIPMPYTADGDDRSPPLSWSGLPEGTKELALIVDDPDAPRDEPFVHWVACHIPPDAELPEGLEKRAQPASLPGVAQGVNSFGSVGYAGPAPPAGHGTHHYIFRVYALDSAPAPAGQLDKESLLEAMRGHVLDGVELIGTYER